VWKRINNYHMEHTSGYVISKTLNVPKPYVLWASKTSYKPLGFFATADEAKQEHERIAR
jgi:hypothetical protein